MLRLEQWIVVDVPERVRVDLDCARKKSSFSDLVMGRRVWVEAARSVRADLLENRNGMSSWLVEELLKLIDAELARADVEAEKYLELIGGALKAES